MMIVTFPQECLPALKAAGWFEDRKVNIDSWVEELTLEGWPKPNELQSAVLTTLGRLHIPPMNRPGQAFGQSEVIIDPLGAAPVGINEIRQLGYEIGEPLYPLGEYNVAAPVALFMTITGRLVDAGSGLAYLYGSDFHSSFINHFARNSLPIDLRA